MIKLTPYHFTKRYVLYASRAEVYRADYSRSVARSLFGDQTHHSIARLLRRMRWVGIPCVAVMIFYWLIILVYPEAFLMHAFVSLWIIGVVYNILSILLMQPDLFVLCLQCFENIYILGMMFAMVSTLGIILDWPLQMRLAAFYTYVTYINTFFMDAWPIGFRTFGRTAHAMVTEMQTQSTQSPCNELEQRTSKLNKIHPASEANSRVCGKMQDANTASGSRDAREQNAFRDRINIFESAAEEMRKGRQERCNDLPKDLSQFYNGVETYIRGGSIFEQLRRRIKISHSMGVPQVWWLLLSSIVPVYLYVCAQFGLFLQYQNHEGYSPWLLFIFKASCLNMATYTGRRLFLQFLYPYKILCLKKKPLRIPLVREWIPIIKIIQNSGLAARSVQEDDQEGTANRGMIDSKKSWLSRRTSDFPLRSNLQSASVRSVSGLHSSLNSDLVIEDVEESPGDSMQQRESRSISSTTKSDGQTIHDSAASDFNSVIPAPQKQVQENTSRNISYILCPLPDEICVDYERCFASLLHKKDGSKFYRFIAKFAQKTSFVVLLIAVLFYPVALTSSTVFRALFFIVGGVSCLNLASLLSLFSIDATSMLFYNFECSFLTMNTIVFCLSYGDYMGFQGSLVFPGLLFVLLSTLAIIYFDAHPPHLRILSTWLLELEVQLKSGQVASGLMSELLRMGNELSYRFVEEENDDSQKTENRPQGCVPKNIEHAMTIPTAKEIWVWFCYNRDLYRIHSSVLIASIILLTSWYTSLIPLVGWDMLVDTQIREIQLYLISFDTQFIVIQCSITFLIFFSMRIKNVLMEPSYVISIYRRTVNIPALAIDLKIES